VPLLTPLTSQVVSDTSEASATARQTAATAWRQVICSGKGRDSDREHSGSGREHSGSGNGSDSGSGSGSVCARALSPLPFAPPSLPQRARLGPYTSPAGRWCFSDSECRAIQKDTKPSSQGRSEQ